MDIEIVGRLLSTLPADDDHPYRTGAWAPQNVEYDADDLEVVAGKIPEDLDGVYLRNTENPLHPAIKFYHPFDGDGMIHLVGFRGGKAFYRNRFVRTDGLLAEQKAGKSLWAGIAEPKHLGRQDGGVGARGALRDSSSTDVVVHRGKALTSFYQCGDLYQLNPYTADTIGKADFKGNFPAEWGVSAHPKIDDDTGEMLFFNYGTTAPYMHYGVVDSNNDLVHYTEVELPGPRLPHDMAFTENYAIMNDFPLFWDESILAKGGYVPRMHQLPSRFGVIPRRGTNAQVRWFEAKPTYVLHFVNAFEDGEWVVIDGFYQSNPNPTPQENDNKWQRAFRYLALDVMGTTLYRWRLNLRTGEVREGPLTNTNSEFGMMNSGYQTRDYRYAYSAIGVPGRFLFNGLVRHDLKDGTEQKISFGDRVYGSETAVAPRVGSASEDDAYLVTIITDMNENVSYALVLDASDITAGPVCKLKLPARVSSGTHSTWAAGEELRRWNEVDEAAQALGL